MKSKTTGILVMTVIAIMIAVTSVGIPESDAAKSQMYEVTITNLTPKQPITPPLSVTHSSDAGFFTPGEMASDEPQQLAENGSTESLVEMLQGKTGILDIVQVTTLVPANDPEDTGLNYSNFYSIC